jgi:hypothetical protein
VVETVVFDLTDMEIDYDPPAELFIPRRGGAFSIGISLDSGA